MPPLDIGEVLTLELNHLRRCRDIVCYEESCEKRPENIKDVWKLLDFLIERIEGQIGVYNKENFSRLLAKIKLPINESCFSSNNQDCIELLKTIEQSNKEIKAFLLDGLLKKIRRNSSKEQIKFIVSLAAAYAENIVQLRIIIYGDPYGR